MAKKSSAVATETHKAKKISRGTAAAYAIRGMTGEGASSIDDLVRSADALYVQSGGTSDMAKAKDWVKDVLKIAIDLGICAKAEIHTTTINRTIS